MRKALGIVLFPLTALLLLVAALAEPTFIGELSWLWWIIGAIGGFSVFGWALRKARG